MGASSLFAVGLAAMVVMLLSRALADRLGLPEVSLLVILGTAAGFLPWMPALYIPPHLILLGFLPPLVYHAAFFSAPRETRHDAIPIMALAFGLTLVTTLAAAMAAHWAIRGLNWAVALAFGAAIAPTDSVSASSVLQRLNAPPRIVTILEGESLINDGVALTVFGLAIEALNISFAAGHGLLRLIQVVVGGVGYGLMVGLVISRVRRRIRDPRSQIIVSLLTPYLAYVPANNLGFSGVLATVAAGFYLGTHTEGMLQPASRLTGHLFWRVLVFLLESALFVLLGLQVRGMLRQMAGYTWSHVFVAAVAVSLVITLVRLAWALGVFPLARFLPGRYLHVDKLSWPERYVIGWSGMRGAISLAIVLSLPMTVHGTPLRGRGDVIILTAMVVFVTLIGHAMTLPALLRRLGMVEADRARIEQMTARAAVIQSALARIDELAENGEVDDHTAMTYRDLYEDRLQRVRAQLDDGMDDTSIAVSARLRREVRKAEQEKLIQLYRMGKISAATWRAANRRVDLEDPDIRRGIG